MEEIKVHVVKYPDRDNLVLRYLCPLTGKHVTKSARTANVKAAEKAAGAWEQELREGRYQKPSKMSWQDFRLYYSENALPAISFKGRLAYESTLNAFEKLCTPQKLSDVTTARVTGFVSELRRTGRSEATIACRLRHLKSSMRWAHKRGLLRVLPVFDMPKRVAGSKIMRGRPITTEEFERMLKLVPKVVENAAAASWKFYLKGLWESGLRLSESLLLRWEPEPGMIVVELDGRRPMLRIPAEAQKGNRDTLLPITPEFANLLESVPKRQRKGRVFKLLDATGSPLHATAKVVGNTVSAIGEKAGVVVDERIKQGETVRKFASAHDLRRAFGARWSKLVMPTVLREMMRHEEIGTTMKYYVGQDAESTADAMWNAAGNISGNSEAKAAKGEKRQNAK